MQTHWMQDFVDVNGSRFHYTRTGAGTGKPVIVLAHGFTDYGLNWSPLVPHLEDRYDIVLPDARGHGRSARAQPAEKIDLAADLAGIIHALDLHAPVVGGHSMGGYTVAALAVRFPDLVRALILEDPAWFDRPAEPQPRQAAEEPPNPWFEWLRSLPDTPIEDVIAKGRKDNPSWPEEEFFIWAEAKKQFDPNFIQTGGVQMPGSWRDTVRALQVPTLLITAEKERGGIISQEMAAEIRSLSPHVQVAYIRGAGHSVRRENSRDYIQAVQQFLSALN